MIVSGDALKSLAQEAALMPQEEMLEVGKKIKSSTSEFQKKHHLWRIGWHWHPKRLGC